ncbi:MAG: cytochrome c3 family protein [Deltaproteobacteria bacterium]|nr:cytochrome c3 family protein [Deltaproteobacteria bacterium]
MRRAVIISILILTAAAAGYVWSRRSDYHDFGGRCLSCHLAEPEEGKDARVFLSDITKLCQSCHTETRELSHPVDMRPSMEVPVSLPLDWKREMTCITCHFAHRDGYGRSHIRSRASGAGLCVLCHADYESELHKASLGAAHIVGDTTRRYIAMEDERLLDDIPFDDLSLKCLTCHDATFANDSLVERRETALGFYHNENGIGLSHPIGVYYADARRKYFGAYKAVKDLPPQIRFFNGMVGCGTCHNPFSKNKHAQLVISNRRSALCFACHRK